MKTFILLCAIVFLLGCANNSEPDVSIDNKSISYSRSDVELNYSSEKIGERLLITMNVTIGTSKLSDRLDLDFSSNENLLDPSQVLVEKANEMINRYQPQTVAVVGHTIDKLLSEQSYVANLSKIDKHNLQGLFFYRAIFKAINRYHNDLAINSKAKLLITPYKGFFTGMTPFVATEDILIDIPNFINYLTSYNGKRLTQTDIDYIIDKVMNYDSINLQEYHSIVTDPVRNSTSRTSQECYLLCGGDCGCCGNYEGQCYFADFDCYVHDYLCQSCSPTWFCFSGCKPTAC